MCKTDFIRIIFCRYLQCKSSTGAEKNLEHSAGPGIERLRASNYKTISLTNTPEYRTTLSAKSFPSKPCHHDNSSACQCPPANIWFHFPWLPVYATVGRAGTWQVESLETAHYHCVIALLRRRGKEQTSTELSEFHLVRNTQDWTQMHTQTHTHTNSLVKPRKRTHPLSSFPSLSLSGWMEKSLHMHTTLPLHLSLLLIYHVRLETLTCVSQPHKTPTHTDLVSLLQITFSVRQTFTLYTFLSDIKMHPLSLFSTPC